MKNIILSVTLLIALISCNGPGSGPLVKESFDKANNPPKETKTPNANVTSEKASVKVEPCSGCITIATLLEGKKSYSGKTVKVTGRVTKFNSDIMGKNWLHIQDGTEYKGGYDLTVTTDQTAAVGEIVTFEGKITLDRDFGYGYIYAILMEEARQVK